MITSQDAHTESATEWIEHGHYGFASRRIHKRCRDGLWQQRHEWQMDDGSIQMDPWIRALPGHVNSPGEAK